MNKSIESTLLEKDLVEDFMTLEKEIKEKLKWKKIINEGLNIDYTILLPKVLCDALFIQLQNTVQYFKTEDTKVKVFGKWHQMPRQVAAYGDKNTKYRYSGLTVFAKPWFPTLKAIRDLLTAVTGIEYNFVLINKYRDGRDHIGEHRDNEPELDRNAPIASISLGQERVFVLRHKDSRSTSTKSLKKIKPVKINLENGSLLLMNPPTNDEWFHSVPPKKSSPGVRINLTFRKLVL